MQLLYTSGTRRHLLQDSDTKKGAIALPPSASSKGDPCSNGWTSVECPSPSSTLLVIVLGMSSMMLVVLIAIVLIYRSHFMFGQPSEPHQQTRPREEAAMLSPVTGQPRSSENMVLVLFPGEKYPVTCAHVSSLNPSSKGVIPKDESHVNTSSSAD